MVLFFVNGIPKLLLLLLRGVVGTQPGWPRQRRSNGSILTAQYGCGGCSGSDTAGAGDDGFAIQLTIQVLASSLHVCQGRLTQR